MIVQARRVTEKALSVRSIWYYFHNVNRFAILYVIYFIKLDNVLFFGYNIVKTTTEFLYRIPMEGFYAVYFSSLIR